uniref:uncharacterized protein LOC143310369 n=1 Tax=Arvicanthis niloticus TaxID=61156 RepID=UPI00402BAA00
MDHIDYSSLISIDYRLSRLLTIIVSRLSTEPGAAAGNHGIDRSCHLQETPVAGCDVTVSATSPGSAAAAIPKPAVGGRRGASRDLASPPLTLGNRAAAALRRSGSSSPAVTSRTARRCRREPRGITGSISARIAAAAAAAAAGVLWRRCRAPEQVPIAGCDVTETATGSAGDAGIPVRPQSGRGDVTRQRRERGMTDAGRRRPRLPETASSASRVRFRPAGSEVSATGSALADAREPEEAPRLRTERPSPLFQRRSPALPEAEVCHRGPRLQRRQSAVGGRRATAAVVAQTYAVGGA